MDESNELQQSYKAWVLDQQVEGCVLSEADNGGVLIEGDLVKGWVNFYDVDGQCIVELRLERVADGEAVFFLHFELEGLDRAKMLFNEMATVVSEMNHREVRHVLLCCSCGMTTTFFAMKLNELAQNMGIDIDFAAKPIEEAKKSGSEYSAVLLAPQVGYQRKDIVEALPDTLVIELPGKIFGAYDAPAALRLVVDALAGGRTVSDESTMRIARDFDKTKSILALSYIHRTDEPTLAYRVLHKGEIACSGMLVLRNLTFNTFKDLSATLLLQGWKTEDFDAIGVAVPSIVDKGISFEMYGGTVVKYKLSEQLSELFGTKVYVHYNACAAAVGCYISQTEYDNVAFHAQAVGVPEGKEGYVVDGKPVLGHGGQAGHVAPIAQLFMDDMDLEDASWRVSGMRQLVARYLTNVVCTLAPDIIFVWCDLLPDMDELRKEMTKLLPDSAIPELVGVADYDDCVLTGEHALCLQRLKKREREQQVG